MRPVWEKKIPKLKTQKWKFEKGGDFRWTIQWTTKGSARIPHPLYGHLLDIGFCYALDIENLIEIVFDPKNK